MAPISPINNLSGILERAAKLYSNEEIIVHSSGKPEDLIIISYNQLFLRAKANVEFIHNLDGIHSESVVLLHFSNHEVSIEWFWSVILAGYLPAISPPLVNDAKLHQKHLSHLHSQLKNPIVLTSEKLLPSFDGDRDLQVHTVEDLLSNRLDSNKTSSFLGGLNKAATDIAVLMLTSGSSGNAKAVCLQYEQIISAIEGKIACHDTATDDVFLNWIGLDHVANLTETHLHAMYFGAKQVHIHASDLLANPKFYLTALSYHQATFSFAPNFFLSSLKRALECENLDWKGHAPDLASIRTITSGGEATVVETQLALVAQLQKYGARDNIIVPGFGMTETCAGAIHNNDSPRYDLENSLEFASLGVCHAGVKMRIRYKSGEIANPGTVGSLELKGPLVFSEYYNNPEATADVFTSDGWFITGDLAIIDRNGMLSLAGREKETININGVKYNPNELEVGLEESGIPGLVPFCNVVFSHRPRGSPTEVILVLYLPAYEPDDCQSRMETDREISKSIMLRCGARPFAIIPLERSHFPKSSLGKISRAKMRTSFEKGEYDELWEKNDKMIKNNRETQIEAPTSQMQETILEIVSGLTDLPPDEIGINGGLMEMGISSFEVIQFKKKLQDHLKIEDIPMVTILTHPTVKELARAIQELAKPKTYNPVVILQSQGTKVPLWLVHPGAGEILVYLNLAKYITERPVYAIRARGFDGEPFFESIPETIATYYSHIKRVQSHGPYAIAGYSFGSMFAFELAKVLEGEGDEVKFIGIMNLPPHVKQRIRQLNMVTAVLTLSLFLELIEDDDPKRFDPNIDDMNHDEVLDEILRRAPPNRMGELALDRAKLLRWAEVSNALHEMAWDYDPSGLVSKLDVFVAHPLAAVARNKEEWFDLQLTMWKDFSDTSPRFNDVEGEHFTMIGKKHVNSFQKKFKAAMAARGL